MGLKDYCTPSNYAWESELYTAYHYEKDLANGNKAPKTVFHFQIPFSPEKEAVLLRKYKLSPNDRMGFYQTLLQGIRREVDISAYLARHDIESILTFSAVEKETDEATGITQIYLESEKVWPILQRQLSVGIVQVLTVIDILYRISVIFRNINKEGVDVVHRGLDLNEVYINENNRILMGGFLYADCPGYPAPPAYLPMFHRNVPEAYLRGERGTQATDIQSLVMLAWNLFSGNPHDLRLDINRLASLEYAPRDLEILLHTGLSLNEDGCNAFRRNYMQCRKDFAKSPNSQAMMPVRMQCIKAYKFIMK